MPGFTFPLDPNTCELEQDSLNSAYTWLYILTRFAMATYTFAMLAESQNRLKYESRFARILAGCLVTMMRVLHTSSEDLAIGDAAGKLIALGPHRTSTEAFAFGSKMKGTPPSFFATDGFNFVPGVASFLNMFKVIFVKAKAKGQNGRSANNDVIELACKALEEQGCVALFPQGNFARIGDDPPRIYNGAATIALKKEIPLHVYRLDGFWSLQNPLIPLSLRNSAYYRAFFSALHMNNIRAIECCVIDFHLKPENKNWSDEAKIKEIGAQLYAFYRYTAELSPEEVEVIKMEIANKAHMPIWENRLKREELLKQVAQLKEANSKPEGSTGLFVDTNKLQREELLQQIAQLKAESIRLEEPTLRLMEEARATGRTPQQG